MKNSPKIRFAWTVRAARFAFIARSKSDDDCDNQRPLTDKGRAEKARRR